MPNGILSHLYFPMPGFYTASILIKGNVSDQRFASNTMKHLAFEWLGRASSIGGRGRRSVA